jgi:hypothetical protein
MTGVIMLSAVMLGVDMLIVALLSVVMLGIDTLIAAMLSVAAPVSMPKILI